MRIAVTQGDPAGIGPEVLVKALARFCPLEGVEILVLGEPEVLAEEGRRLDLPLPPDVEPVAGALAALERSAELARLGEAQGIVTAPVHKARLRGEGFGFPGQTEFFAARLSAREHAMMLASGGLRVVPITTHLALSEVPKRLETERIVTRVGTVANALRLDFGIADPRIAVLGLNPHAGEDGHFGREEEEIIRPAVEALLARGICVEGPLPADAAFSPRIRDRFDTLVGMYHDQVLAPFKALAAGGGVNVTLGLPVVRTSPDHGTADDIAGRGVADPESFLAALHLAVETARRREGGSSPEGSEGP